MPAVLRLDGADDGAFVRSEHGIGDLRPGNGGELLAGLRSERNVLRAETGGRGRCSKRLPAPEPLDDGVGGGLVGRDGLAEGTRVLGSELRLVRVVIVGDFLVARLDVGHLLLAHLRDPQDALLRNHVATLVGRVEGLDVGCGRVQPRAEGRGWNEGDFALPRLEQDRGICLPHLDGRARVHDGRSDEQLLQQPVADDHPYFFVGYALLIEEVLIGRFAELPVEALCRGDVGNLRVDQPLGQHEAEFVREGFQGLGVHQRR